MKSLKLFFLLLCCCYTTNTHADAAEIITHIEESEYQDGKHNIFVLLPDNYDKNKAYRVLYVLPTKSAHKRKKEEKKTKKGPVIEVFKKMDAHNKHDIIIVQMEFDKTPWYGDHVTDKKARQASYVKDFVVPYIEKKYSTLGNAEGRLLFGFSKSGWGAYSLIFKYPEFFGYAASWDAPLFFDKFYWGMDEVYGTLEQLKLYRPELLAPKNKKHFQEKTRLILGGEHLWGTMREGSKEGSHTINMHKLLTKENVKHVYQLTKKYKHSWTEGWVAPTLESLVKLTKEK